MSILIIGCGSMGRRRVRCLQALGYKDIIGYDPRQDRCDEAHAATGIKCATALPAEKPSTCIISVPPKYHAEYAERFKGIQTFIEAGTEKLEFGTPSATMLFNPIVLVIREKLSTLGKIINITYHCGQYLPDWHPYEKVSEFYAGECGAIEMVAFELMWMTHLFGFPIADPRIMTRQGNEIEGLQSIDTASFIMALSDRHIITSITIDVVSRTPIRQLIINGTEKQLRYDLNQGVSEQMYIDETKAFMDGKYPNTLEHSNRVIEVTKQICG